MTRYTAFLFAFIFSSPFFSQNAPVTRLKVGDATKETINYSDSWNNPQVTQVPAIYHVIFYRYRDTLGNVDNTDSIIALEKVLKNIETELKESSGYKALHIECHSHVQTFSEATPIQKALDKKRAESAEANKTSYGWSFMSLDETKLKINSVLNAGKIVVVSPKGRILYTGYIGGLTAEAVSKVKQIKGKLLTESDGKKVALERAKVTIIKFDKINIDETYTNKDGEFELDLPENVSYTLNAKPTSTMVSNIILATQNGREIAKFVKGKDGFNYPLLKADISLLTLKDEDDDITMNFGKFKTGKGKELKVTENVSYAVGQFSVESSSEPVLNEIVEALKADPKVKLNVISHTDSQGDDAANLALSEKRASAVVDYFVSKGIDRSRLKAIGKGETAVRNRCKNGVDCSKKEHEYNRRTEFHFTKT
jgi:outer membrane protein OmpA-like peptidoglycan-associated protein